MNSQATPFIDESRDSIVCLDGVRWPPPTPAAPGLRMFSGMEDPTELARAIVDVLRDVRQLLRLIKWATAAMRWRPRRHHQAPRHGQAPRRDPRRRQE